MADNEIALISLQQAATSAVKQCIELKIDFSSEAEFVADADSKYLNTEFVDMYNDMRVITVPSARFNTSITLNAPTAHDGKGGYTASGATINYMIVHPSAILQVMEHYAPRVFSPEQNIEAEAWRVQPRYVHGAWVKAHKTNGIYVSKGTVSSN